MVTLEEEKETAKLICADMMQVNVVVVVYMLMNVYSHTNVQVLMLAGCSVLMSVS